MKNYDKRHWKSSRVPMCSLGKRRKMRRWKINKSSVFFVGSIGSTANQKRKDTVDEKGKTLFRLRETHGLNKYCYLHYKEQVNEFKCYRERIFQLLSNKVLPVKRKPYCTFIKNSTLFIRAPHEFNIFFYFFNKI